VANTFGRENWAIPCSYENLSIDLAACSVILCLGRKIDVRPSIQQECVRLSKMVEHLKLKVIFQVIVAVELGPSHWELHAILAESEWAVHVCVVVSQVT
jgi:hypothetical protein